MSRPKGIIQKRNQSKYWLPDGIAIQLNPPADFRKDTKLIFIDNEFGEFITTFRALQGANASTHPRAVVKRRSVTNIEKYGSNSPAGCEEVKNKIKNTNIIKYGHENPLGNKDVRQKALNTNLKLYGTSNPMELSHFKNKIKETSFEKYGVANAMQNNEIQDKLKKSNLSKYGVTNPGGLPESREKALSTLTKSDKRFASKEELEIKEFIESLGFKTKKSYIGGADPKEFDISIIDSNIKIEFNGLYWHSLDSLIKNNKKDISYKDKRLKALKYHLNKTELCEANNYKLIHIFEHLWSESKNQFKSFLRSSLGKNEIIIPARKTIIKEVPNNEAREFLKTYHILKAPQHIKNAIGLYYNDELLCMATLSFHHRGGNQLTLNRFIGKENVTVVGGLSKLSKHILNTYGNVVTWIDRTISDGKGWEKCGWVREGVLPPDYFYYNPKTHKVISKQSRQKKKINTPKEITEEEQAKIDGLVKVYDCGKIRLRLK